MDIFYPVLVGKTPIECGFEYVPIGMAAGLIINPVSFFSLRVIGMKILYQSPHASLRIASMRGQRSLFPFFGIPAKHGVHAWLVFFFTFSFFQQATQNSRIHG